MACYINGLSKKETAELTRAMAYSGHVLTLKRHECDFEPENPDKAIAGIRGFVDKHSTGGVGDKVSLILSPLLTSIGFKVSKFSGRSLGHTGGTVDKLESIPGFRTEISLKKFEKQIDDIGIALAAQTQDFAPADKILYNLRDKTNTVDSIPLIASSVMSKKVAGGADIILIDLKCGSGAFMQDLSEAKKLKKSMEDIAKLLKLDLKVTISNMDQPLGYSVGNALEMMEALEILAGELKNDTYDLVLELGSQIAETKELKEALKSGKAYVKFEEWIEAQGGSLKAFEDSLQEIQSLEYKAPEEGYVKSIDSKRLGEIANTLCIEPQIAASNPDAQKDYLAGIKLHKKIGDKVKKGDLIFSVHGSVSNKLKPALNEVLEAYVFSKSKIKKPKLVLY